jgi:NADH-quinone oxidoreductase subunit G
VGAYIANANGARRQLHRAEKAYLLLNAEPELDAYNPQAAAAALEGRDGGGDVGLQARHGLRRRAAADRAVQRNLGHLRQRRRPRTELQRHRQAAAGNPSCWKVLRVLGNILGLSGFDYDTSEAIRDEVLGAGVTDVSAKLNNRSALRSGRASATGTERIADVPIYFADAIVRRAESLQRWPMRLRRKRTCRQRWPSNWAWPPATRSKSPKVPAAPSWSPPSMPNCQPTPCVAAHASTAALGGMFGSITVEKAGEGEIMALPEFVTTINTMGANSVLALLAADLGLIRSSWCCCR